MGTQFTSRLTASDRRRIIDGIRRVTRVVTTEAKAPRARKAPPLPAPQLHRVSEAVVGVVLDVAEAHEFFEVLLKSDLFEAVLRWLLDLQHDAYYNGFQKHIRKYGLAQSPNPVAELSRRLAEVARGTEQPDRFKSSVVLAAKAVLSDAVVRPAPATFASASAAERLGGQLAELQVPAIAKRYITAFLEHFLADAMHRSDTGRNRTLIERAIDLSRDAVHRFARATVAKVADQKKEHDPAGIRRIVVEQLRLLQGRAKASTAA